MNKQTFDQIGNIVVAPFAAMLIYLSLRIGASKIEKRDFSVYGMTLSITWMRQFLLGFILSALLMTLIFVVEYLASSDSCFRLLHADLYYEQRAAFVGCR